MIATVATFPLVAILLRTRLVPLMARTENARRRIGFVLEAGAAIAIIMLGTWPLLGK